MRLLGRHLTEENHRAVLALAENKSRREIETLVAELAPRPDAPSLVRKLPSARMETQVERKKLGKAVRPGPPRAIRPGTDGDAPEGPLPPRDPPNVVRRAVWARDEGRCAYVSPQGRRCVERTFLEFHHRRPYVKRGEATVDNIALRCRRHNQYEADLVFGIRRGHAKRLRDRINDASPQSRDPPGSTTTPGDRAATAPRPFTKQR